MFYNFQKKVSSSESSATFYEFLPNVDENLVTVSWQSSFASFLDLFYSAIL